MLEISSLEEAEALLKENRANFQKVSGSKGIADSLCISLPCQNILMVYASISQVFEEDFE